MADSKISQLTPITGANILDSDEFIIARPSTFENFSVTRTEFFQSTPAITTLEMTTDAATVNGNITVTGTVDGRDVAADGSKLDGIESNATADQTALEIKTAYESNLDTNAFTDAEQTKLSGIESNADVTDTANVTAAGALMDSELTSEASVKALDQGVATTDDPTFTNTQLAEIAASKADTAVDVFVYDTSKDSDGGAWRKRTQHTSWYNETLNTSTRGSRREFPAVAVIVLLNNTLTVYDGDDPSLRMWKVLEGDTNNAFKTGVAAAVTASNGLFSVAYGTGAGLGRINWIEDKSNQIFNVDRQRDYLGGLGQANDGLGYEAVRSAGGGLVDATTNDVAMTILPDAPIDPATGLPVPTIAVATEGGTSVIQDDGTVYDITRTGGHNVLAILDGDKVAVNRRSGGFDVYVHQLPLTADTTDFTGELIHYGSSGNIDTGLFLSSSARLEQGVIAGSSGLSLTAPNYANPNSSMVAVITSSWNSGYQNGDIKGAFLSDTDDTDLVGSGELVTNGTFDTDSDWTKTGGWSIAAGEATLTSGSGSGEIYQDVTGLAAGKTYVAQVEVTTGFTGVGTAAPFQIRAADNTSSLAEVELQDVGTGVFSLTFIPTSSTHRVRLFGFDNLNGSIDNISVKLADADRSVNANSLSVNGTITRTPVASGADLVAYSGFSSSNYLSQPYNADLDFGTGDFCVMGWFKGTDADGILVARDSVPTAENFYVRILSGQVQCRIDDDSTSSIFSGGSGLNNDSWNFVSLVKSGSSGLIYVNGSLAHTQDISAVGDLDNSNANLRIGNNQGLTNPWGGSLALLRISATAPTAEQIAKIYNDEKVLFQENAQATLYGSSDAVTALAHDPVTDLFHVGTSDGRSVFQGLRRVENTTDAVTTAISAHNGLVIEQ